MTIYVKVIYIYWLWTTEYVVCGAKRRAAKATALASSGNGQQKEGWPREQVLRWLKMPICCLLLTETGNGMTWEEGWGMGGRESGWGMVSN